MKVIFLLLLIVMGAGCESVGVSNRTAIASLVKSAERHWTKAGFSEARLEVASRLYIVKCARCHQVYDPSDYTQSRWNFWMSRMSKTAHLDADQEQLLSQFAAAIRVAQDEGPGNGRK